MKDKIDKIIEELYSQQTMQELDALSLLISDEFLSKLENQLNSEAREFEYFTENFKVSLGWIDKIPLVNFTTQTFDINKNQINSKVELGDLLFIYNQNDTTNGRKRHTASIIQAKSANNITFHVPIAQLNNYKVTSTSKELALLSQWPVFDLYKTSTSSKPELNNLYVKQCDKKSKFMGYYNRIWLCGKPQLNEPCNITLGKHITDIIKFIDGEEFSTEPVTDWDILINKLIIICKSYSLPKSKYGHINQSRFKESDYIGFHKIKTQGEKVDAFSIGSEDNQKFPIIFIDKVQIEGIESLKKNKEI